MSLTSDPFQYFGLSQDNATEKALKSAYAAKLKITRPDDNRDEFLKLRQAYNSAMQYLKWQQDIGSQLDDDDVYDANNNNSFPVSNNAQALSSSLKRSDPQAKEEDKAKEEVHETSHNQPAANISDTIQVDYSSDPVTQAIEDIQKLILHPWRASSIECWQEILERDELVSLDSYQELNNEMLNFICQKTGFDAEYDYILKIKWSNFTAPLWLTVSLLKYLDEYFGWSDRSTSNEWQIKKSLWIAVLIDRNLTESVKYYTSNSEPVTTKYYVSAFEIYGYQPLPKIMRPSILIAVIIAYKFIITFFR